jgi:hypothetical protein
LRTRWSYTELLDTPESLLEALIEVANETPGDPFEDS